MVLIKTETRDYPNLLWQVVNDHCTMRNNSQPCHCSAPKVSVTIGKLNFSYIFMYWFNLENLMYQWSDLV